MERWVGQDQDISFGFIRLWLRGVGYINWLSDLEGWVIGRGGGGRTWCYYAGEGKSDENTYSELKVAKGGIQVSFENKQSSWNVERELYIGHLRSD